MLVITMRGNPTTGYGWYLKNANELNEDVLIPKNLNEHNTAKDYVTDEHPEGMVGVGGSYKFKFLCNKASEENVDLVFEYKRPWEKNEALRTVTVKVNLIA
jgi:predicted secreted protein